MLYCLTDTELLPSPLWPEPARGGDKSGGARRDRTDDLMLAKHALSQLSYGPVPVNPGRSDGGPGKI